MKNEENQKLSYKNLIFMSSLAGLLGFITIPSWTRQRDEDRIVNAKRHAEVLGYQIFEIYREAAINTSSPSPGSRAPASASHQEGVVDFKSFRKAGSIGNDPWGQPYQYKILSAVGDEMKVQIWSAGPNKSFETKDEPGVAAEAYVADDVGVVLSLNRLPQE